MNDDIHDYSFESNGGAKINGKTIKVKEVSSSTTFIGKVFLTMFVGLLITSGVAIGLAYLFAYLLATSSNPETVFAYIIGGVVISGISLLIMSFVLPITFARGKHSMLIPSIIFAILMGGLLSVEVLITDIEILLLALGATTLIFGIMAAIGFLGKGRLTGLSVAISGLFMGLLILSIINIVIMLMNPGMANMSLYWIISLGFFAVIMLITLWDMRNIKRISERASDAGNNLVLYCAFVIYTDFIAILIRLIYYLGIASRR